MIQKMNFSEGYFMNVQIMSTPCYLLETVELIYAFVNGVPAEELTGPGSYCIPVREVQRLSLIHI